MGDREGWQIKPERFMGLGVMGFEIRAFPKFLLSPGLHTHLPWPGTSFSSLFVAVIPGPPLGLSSYISSSRRLPLASLGRLG